MAKKATPRQQKISRAKRMVKELRKITDSLDPSAGYDLREIEHWKPQRFAAVTRKYKEYTNFITAFNMDVMPTRKFRNPERREALREWSGVDYPAWIDAEYIPKIHLADSKPAKVEWTKNNQPVFRRGRVGYAYFNFDKNGLINDPEGEVKKVAFMAEAVGAKSYSIRNGDAWMRAKPMFAEILEDEVMQLMERYDAGENPDVDASKDWRRWLNGIEAYVTEVGAGYEMDTIEGRFTYGLSQSRRQAGQKQKRQAKLKYERLTGKKYKRKKKASK